jgi:hypothetical protein
VDRAALLGADLVRGGDDRIVGRLADVLTRISNKPPWKRAKWASTWTKHELAACDYHM